MKEYTVLPDEGITLAGGEVILKDAIVSMGDEEAQSFLDAGKIELVAAPEGENHDESDESQPEVEETAAPEGEAEIDELTGSEVGVIDTTSLPPETIPSSSDDEVVL